jgi:FAD/FMN-containing dehydrogenase
MHSPLLALLSDIVGQNHVLVDGDLSQWETDWRKREHGRALAVVRPGSTEQVAQVVRACASAGVSIVPQGGNTGMVVGSTPDASGTQVVLCTTRMNRVRELDTANLTITAEAGCILQQLQESCQAAGLLFALSMASQGSCTLGGNLGTNAGGTQVVRYGNTRELCLGLEVVNARGEIWNGLSGLRKDNTGYDLRHLFIGSEGTLGIITAATMKLYPLPAAQLTAMAAVPSLEAAVQLLGQAHRILGAGLTGFEVMGRFALDLVAKHFPQLAVPDYRDAAYCVLLENSDGTSQAHAREQLETLLAEGLAAGTLADAVLATSVFQGRALWQIRESVPLAQAREGLNVKHDISLPISRIAEFVRETDAALAAQFPGVRLVNYGHLGDGNLHYNVQAPVAVNAQEFLVSQESHVNALVYAKVEKFGGSISAEHGIGSLKRDKLAQHKSAVALAMMRSIKDALDPHGLFNPGRVLALRDAAHQ